MLQRSQGLMFVARIMTALMLFTTAGCAGTKSVNRTQDGSSQPPAPKRIATSDLKKLRWIEGTWRGTGDVESPFFERYHFENDSVLVVESFSDETLSKVSEVTRFELRDGQLGNWGEGARWAASQIDDRSITFEPVARARNTFRWEWESKDVWKAVLAWTASESSPAKQKIYRMERLTATK